MFSFSGDLGFIILVIVLGSFLVSVNSLLNFFLLCEIIWIGLYFICIIYGSWGDSLLFCIWGIVFLCLATSETVVGLSLILLKDNLEVGIREFQNSQVQHSGRGYNFSKFWSSII